MIVCADSLDAQGRGICPADNLEIHVDQLLPGESAEVAIVHRSPHRPVAWGRIERRIGDDSPDRIEPACPAFGACGGCTLQHLSLPAQHAFKRQRVQNALGIADVQTVFAPSPLGYRNKGKYVVGRIGSRLVLGAYRPRTHDLVDTAGCRVVEPAIDAMASRVRDALDASGLAIYDERRRDGYLRHVVIRSGCNGDLLVAIAATSTTPPDPLERVARQLEGASGVVWVKNDSTSGTVVTDDVVVLAGRPTVPERIGGATVGIGASEFFQVNRAQALALYDAVAEATGAGPARRAVDVYCGVGGIALTLAARGASVVGIERQAIAVDAANRAAAGAGLADRARFVTGDASSLSDYSTPPPDIVVVNPPRKGLDTETQAALHRLRPRAIAYVSCSPESLARDLSRLTDYAVDSVTVFDLMPGTPQIETVAILRACR